MSCTWTSRTDWRAWRGNEAFVDAHLIAVEWDGEDGPVEGVYIPRRDTDSLLNHFAGSRLFPGVHHLARFDVQETGGRYRVELTSKDGETRLNVDGTAAQEFPKDSVFESLQEASDFFERGTLGYSATAEKGNFDGLELKTDSWSVQALDVKSVESIYFQKSGDFPEHSVHFDHALLMKGIDHEWIGRPPLCCSPEA